MKRSIIGLLGALLVSSISPALAASPPQGTVARPEPCRDLPVSSALVEPVSCFITGPRSVLIAGNQPGAMSTGTAIVVDGQRTRKSSAPGSGPLKLRGLAHGHACLAGDSGQYFDFDTASARLARTSGTACPAAVSSSGRMPMGTASEEIIAPAQAAGGPPAPASSYYVYGADVASCIAMATSGCPLYVDGADEPSPSGGALAILDFGASCYATTASGTVYGAQLFNTSVCTADDQLLPLAGAFFRGYASTHGAGSPPMILGLGTSNNTNGVNPNNMTAQQLTDSGSAWFTNLVKPFAATSAGAAAPVVAWGADDIEDSNDATRWYGPNETITWVNGYGAAAAAGGLSSSKHCSGNDPYRLGNYGDNVLGNGGWTDDNIYYVTWGAPVACAVPEIYYSSMAAEWQRTSAAKGPIPFTGPLSLGGEGGTPTTPTLSMQGSWNALASATGQSPPYLTDIGSLNASTPSAPQNALAFPGDTTATVWWSPPSADGGSPVQDYVVTAYAGSMPGPSATVSGLPPPTTATVRGLTNGTSYTFVVAATNSAGTGAGSVASNAVVPGPGRYHPLTPTRILDTRNGTGAPQAPLGPQGQLTLQVTGTSPLPSSGVAAVVLNVTVTDTTSASYLAVWPDSLPRPTASNLNWRAGTTVPNLVEVPIGPSGGVSFFNALGSTSVIADVEGYVGLANETTAPDGLYTPVTPSRVLDTREGIGHAGHLGGGTLNVIAVPVAQPGQEAVVLNVTVTGGTAASYLTVWPDGQPQPGVSNLNFSAGQTIANRVMVKVGTSGKIDIYNALGTVDAIADLGGAFSDQTVGGTGAKFQGVQPVRILDTRNGGGPLGQGATRAVAVAGTYGIPSGATAVVANVTVTNTTASSVLTAWPDGAQKPTASDLNWVAHETVPNLVVVKLGAGGKLDLYNAIGSTDVLIDVVGWYE